MCPPDTSPRILAVVVAFHPDPGSLRKLLQSLAPQVQALMLVDNTPVIDRQLDDIAAEIARGRVGLQGMGENLGIAKAINVGVEWAKNAGATHVLLSDQDSLPEADMVAGLLRTYRDLVGQGIKVGAVAPTFTDTNTGITFPFQAEVPGKFFYGHLRPDDAHPVVEALTLITSGTLVPIEAFTDVGPMREDFFIDHVDIEWCHRARARGWRLFGTSNARMHHSMGRDASLRVWYFGWRREPAYSPLRMYYRIRNFVALCRLPYIGWRWKVRNGWYCLGLLYSHAVFGSDKLASVVMAVRGLLDGLRGRMGVCRASEPARD